MINRRHFLQVTCASLMMPTHAFAKPSPWMPDEGHPHQATLMAWIANRNIWTTRQAKQLEKELLTLAHTIAEYEPVFLLVRPKDLKRLQRLLAQQPSDGIQVIPTPMDDLWLRDTGPIIVQQDGTQMGVDFNFNGWGNKQPHRNDRNVANHVTQHLGLPTFSSELVMEGGSIEVDGQGTAILTESSVLNNNRNPGWSKSQVEAELARCLGISHCIWLPGIRNRDITDAHIDFYARFVAPGQVLVAIENDRSHYDYAITRQNQALLEQAKDAEGRSLSVHTLANPETFNTTYGNEYFAPGYLGFYLVNGAMIMQKFGDKKADALAQETLKALFPNRQIQAIATDALASGGGTIHCATQQIPQLALSRKA